MKVDACIICFGMSLFVRLGLERALEIAQRMTQLARLHKQIAKMMNVAQYLLTLTVNESGFDDLFNQLTTSIKHSRYSRDLCCVVSFRVLGH